jgi:hypothetical protein
MRRFRTRVPLAERVPSLSRELPMILSRAPAQLILSRLSIFWAMVLFRSASGKLSLRSGD